MILSPTKDHINDLSPISDYTVFIPGVRINICAPKTISTQKTIGGGSTMSIWESNISGETRNISVRVSNSVYEKLQRIKDSNIHEWLLRIQGKIFVVVFDLASAIRKKNTDKWLCNITLVFTREETR